MSDLTRAEIDKIIGEDFDEISENGLKAIVSLSMQLDAANAKIALHESENVTRGLLIGKLEAQLQTVQSSLTNARRTLPMRLWSDCGTSLASEDATTALDRALERMRERCADHLRAQLEYLKSKGWSADYSFIAVCEGTMRALPLHEDQKP